VKAGDLVRYRLLITTWAPYITDIYIVHRVEYKNDWVFIYGCDVPLQMRLLEVISESR